MANKPVRQFKTHMAPAGARGYQTKRPIRKLEGDKNPSGHPTGGTLGQGKLSDDSGRKEHGSVAGGRLKLDPTVGSSAMLPYELLYQQRLAEANQPPPLPQPSTNIPLAVDPRDAGYIPQQTRQLYSLPHKDLSLPLFMDNQTWASI